MEFSTPWKTFFHSVEKLGKVFTFYVIFAESFYVLWKTERRESPAGGKRIAGQGGGR